MQVPTESSSTRRAKRNLICQRQQDRKENEGSNCFMCFGVRTHRTRNHQSTNINDEFEIWKPGIILCSQSCTPYDSGQTQLKLKTTSDRKFIYVSQGICFSTILCVSHHWCMHRDLILEYETWRPDKSHEFCRGPASGLPGWFPVQGHSRLSRFQFDDWFYKLKEKPQGFPWNTVRTFAHSLRHWWITAVSSLFF